MPEREQEIERYVSEEGFVRVLIHPFESSNYESSEIVGVLRIARRRPGDVGKAFPIGVFLNEALLHLRQESY